MFVCCKVPEAARAQEILIFLHGAAEIVRRVGVGTHGHDLAAKLAVELQPLRSGERIVAAVGVKLDADALFDGAAQNFPQPLFVAVKAQIKTRQLLA